MPGADPKGSLPESQFGNGVWPPAQNIIPTLISQGPKIFFGEEARGTWDHLPGEAKEKVSAGQDYNLEVLWFGSIP